MTILRHPSLPEVEPRAIVADALRNWAVLCSATKGVHESGAAISGPVCTSKESAITAWNDWVRPLVELQAEVDKLREEKASMATRWGMDQGHLVSIRHENERLTADLAAANAEVERLADVINAIMLDRDRLKADLAAEKARAERYREALENIAAVPSDFHPCSSENAIAIAALNDQPEQPTQLTAEAYKRWKEQT